MGTVRYQSGIRHKWIHITGMVQAWVAHFVTPLKCTYDKYDWQVMSQKLHKCTNHLTNTITAVVAPLAPPAVWI